MFGKNIKKRRFVIMDGSDKDFVQNIKGLAEMYVCKSRIINFLTGKIRIRRLDKQHPTMKVVTIRSTYRDWSELRKLLERDYSEQCVFDAPL